MNSIYSILSNQAQNRATIYLRDEGGEISLRKIGKLLGAGGSKRAFELDRGEVLMWTNFPRIVEEECKISMFLRRIGLLNPNHRQVEWHVSEELASPSAPFYVSSSFESFREKDIYIIDRKNVGSDTWNGKIFVSREVRENPENWSFALDELIKDVAKLLFYKVPVPDDSLNTAIAQTRDGIKL